MIPLLIWRDHGLLFFADHPLAVINLWYRGRIRRRDLISVKAMLRAMERINIFVTDAAEFLYLTYIGNRKSGQDVALAYQNSLIESTKEVYHGMLLRIK